MNHQNELTTKFKSTFEQEPAAFIQAPGRVNLIGGSVDYNDGFVLPVAIDKSVRIAAAPRKDGQLKIYSENYQALVEVSLDNLETSDKNSWANYVKGVAFFLQQSGAALNGADLFITGDIPPGAGLSSSAALEIAAAYTFLTLNHLNNSEIDIIKLCQKTENEFVGAQCGIMDQFISCFGRKNHALFLDCRTLEYEAIPVPDRMKILFCETGVSRQLAASGFNRRREECQIGVQELSRELPEIRALRDVSLAQLESHRHLLDSTIYKRCRHVVSEIERVQKSAEALKRNDLAEFGSLIYQSHFSLKHDFENSCPELDAIVDICAECEGVYGARLSGGGFGGAALAIVGAEFVEDVSKRLKTEYPKKSGKQPTIHICSIEDGVSVSIINEPTTLLNTIRIGPISKDPIRSLRGSLKFNKSALEMKREMRKEELKFDQNKWSRSGGK